MIRTEIFSHLRKIKTSLFGWDAWVGSKVLLCGLFSWPSWTVIKIIPLWEIPNVFNHYPSDKKNWHSHNPSYGLDKLAGIVVNHSQDLSNKFGRYFRIWTITVRFLRGHTFIITIRLIQYFTNLPDSNPMNSAYGIFRFKCKIVQHVVSKFLEEYIVS